MTNETVPVNVPDPILKKLEAIAGEHFDDYLLVVTRGTQTWHTFNTAHAASGLASFVGQKVNKAWWSEDKNSESK